MKVSHYRVGTLTFVVVSYLGTLVQPSYQNFTNLDSAAVELVAMVGGNLFVSLFLAGMLIGCFASGRASQASASRVLGVFYLIYLVKFKGMERILYYQC